MDFVFDIYLDVLFHFYFFFFILISLYPALSPYTSLAFLHFEERASGRRGHDQSRYISQVLLKPDAAQGHIRSFLWFLYTVFIWIVSIVILVYNCKIGDPVR